MLRVRSNIHNVKHNCFLQIHEFYSKTVWSQVYSLGQRSHVKAFAELEI